MARKTTVFRERVPRNDHLALYDFHDPEKMRQYFANMPKRPPAADATDAGILPDGAQLIYQVPKKRLPSTLTKKHRRVQFLYDRDGRACWYCGAELLPFPLPVIPKGESLPRLYPTIDEVIPTSKGGRRTKKNQRVACRSCNNKKGDSELARAVKYG